MSLTLTEAQFFFLLKVFITFVSSFIDLFPFNLGRKLNKKLQKLARI